MKKKDGLEEFIEQQRELFDLKIPDEKIWENISKQVNSHKMRIVWYRSNLFRSIAAGFTLLVIGGSIGFLIANKKESPLWNVGIASETFIDFEMASQKSINEKLFQLRELNAEESIFSDLKQMDRSMEELNKELERIPSGQEKIILEQLKRGYQTKIDILDKIIYRLESKTQKQDEKAI
jgi:hypothetical protein